MKGKTILLVASYYGPYGGNFVASLLAFDSEIKAQGGRIVYVFPSDVKDYAWIPQIEELNETIYFIPYKPYSLDNVKRLRSIIRVEKADVVFSRMGGWDLTACFADWRIPIIWHLEYALNLKGKKNQFKYWLKYRLFGRNAYNIAVSDASTDQVNLFKPKHSCVSIPNALDFSRLQAKNIVNEIKSVYNILMFAYSPYVKGLDIALNSLEELNKKSVKYRLLVSAQERTHKYLNERYDKLPVWIQLLGATSDVASIYERADVMLSASRQEGFSYCLAEAIFSGVPVIYSDIPGTSWADEFRAAYKFKSEDIKDLENVIEYCIKTKISLEDVEHNRELLNLKYSMRSWNKQILDVVNEAMGTP